MSIQLLVYRTIFTIDRVYATLEQANLLRVYLDTTGVALIED